MSDHSGNSSGRPRRHILATIATALGIATAPAGANAQRVTPEAAPRTWVTFAETVNGKVTGWLRSDDAASTRLRAYLSNNRTDRTKSSAPLILRVWTDKRGIISRLECPPFGDEAPDADLRAALIGRDVGIRPPRGILFPLTLAVQLDPAPLETGPAAQTISKSI